MSISHNPLDSSTTTSKTSTTLAGAKRKREHPEEIRNGSHQGGTHLEQLHQLFKDTVQLLKGSLVQSLNLYNNSLTLRTNSHDVTQTSILDSPIPSIPRASPVTKKTKSVASTDHPSIARLVESDAYNSIDALSQDLESVTASVIETLESKDKRHPDVTRVLAFKRQFRNIILRELLQRPHLMPQRESKDQPSSPGDATFDEPSLGSAIANAEDDRDYGSVLTLFGGTNQPRQLFSSLKDNSTLGDEALPSRTNEVGLPNGISFTRIVPVHSKGRREDTKDVPILKELFAPPSNVPSLNPPRPSRHTATRSSSVNWYNPSQASTPSRPSRRDSFSTQPLSTGQWLTYNVAPSTKDMSSPDSKRKQRDRALSFGEPRTELSEQTLALHRQAKEDALFRSAYSGFAPDRDNAGALVSERSKNQIWWQRVGEQRYLDSILSWNGASTQDDVDGLSDGDGEMDNSGQEVSLQEAVDSWVPEENPLELSGAKQRAGIEATTAKEIDEILGEVSELLETLNSYQDVRNLSLSNNARTPISQNPQLSAMTGTPTSPSAEEVDIYNMLKSQLSIMVASLPPYALARLDGQKLGVLNVNTKIQVETPNYPGSLEEDEISTRGRLPAVGIAAGYPARTANAAVGLAPRNSYLAATSTPAALSHRPSHMPQTVPTRSTAAPSYLPNQQYPTRPPSAHQYLANNARPAYPTQRPISSSTPDRYPYSTPQQYGQAAGRPSYGNGYNQYAGQNGTAYGQGYAHSQQPSASGRAAPTSYQQPARSTQSYTYTPTPTTSGGSASPSKAAVHYLSHGYTNQSSTPSQVRPAPYQPQPSNYNAQPSTSPQVNGSGNVQGTRPDNQLAVSMNSQKSPVGEAARGNSMTPQPVNSSQAGPGQGSKISAGQANEVTT
ncbi:MAG: hypothetical protein L6R39_002635 [Caloplaca ligustica]|nr:MAG: hypothetical protein L6R39_002635 [Caloplaca ligustica]